MMMDHAQNPCFQVLIVVAIELYAHPIWVCVCGDCMSLLQTMVFCLLFALLQICVAVNAKAVISMIHSASVHNFKSDQQVQQVTASQDQ